MILPQQAQHSVAPSPSLASTTDSALAPPDVSLMPPAQATVTLANWNYDHKSWPEAIELYQRAISLGLDNADVRTDLGNAFRFSGEPQKALEQYQIAQRENPQHDYSLFNTATLYAQALNDSAKADETWREYLRRFPQGENAASARKFLTGADEDKRSNAKLVDWLANQKSDVSK